MAEINSANYITVSGWMLQDLGLKGNELLIYAIIYGFSQDKKSSYFGDQDYLATWTNSTIRTVIRTLNNLTHKGLLEAKDLPGSGNRKSYRAIVTNCHIESDKMSCQHDKMSHPNIYKNNITNYNHICADGFDRFWSAYPNKKAKDKARKAWEKLNADEALIERIMAALEKQKKSRQWTKDGGEFIPHPATWLNGRRWEDQVTEQKRGFQTNDVQQEDLDKIMANLMEDI